MSLGLPIGIKLIEGICINYILNYFKFLIISLAERKILKSKSTLVVT